MDGKLLHDIDGAGRILNLGRTSIYAEIAAGALLVVKARGRTLVPQAAIEEYVEKKIAQARAERAA